MVAGVLAAGLHLGGPVGEQLVADAPQLGKELLLELSEAQDGGPEQDPQALLRQAGQDVGLRDQDGDAQSIVGPQFEQTYAGPVAFPTALEPEQDFAAPLRHRDAVRCIHAFGQSRKTERFDRLEQDFGGAGVTAALAVLLLVSTPVEVFASTTPPDTATLDSTPTTTPETENRMLRQQMRELAEESLVSVPTLYNLFGGKNELLSAVVESYFNSS